MMNISKLLFCLCVVQSSIFAQGILDRKEPKKVVKSGPYIGIQSGRFYAGEVGVERQWKRSDKFLQSTTNALHMGVNYSYDFYHFNPILGYDLGFWHKEKTIGLTYGMNVCMRTNFDQYRVGICPTIGIKILQFHIQTGYHLLYPFNRDYASFDANTIFLSARFLIVNEREKK
jgi:hypothetical protein